MEKYRNELNEIDLEMRDLFIKRMHVVKDIAKYKKTHGLDILDVKREQDIIQRLMISEPMIKDLYGKFLSEILSLSKIYQKTLMEEDA